MNLTYYCHYHSANIYLGRLLFFEEFKANVLNSNRNQKSLSKKFMGTRIGDFIKDLFRGGQQTVPTRRGGVT